VTTERRQERMRALRERHHPHCLICGAHNNRGLQVPFRACEDGSVTASMTFSADLQGYRGVAHGGIVASLLDAAMVNCLFTHDIVAMTAELVVRFMRPVAVGQPAEVRAWQQAARPPLHEMSARLPQGKHIVARATAKFMEVPDSTADAESERPTTQPHQHKETPPP
jgi:uncharacterized protein (TIGR00369 family)